MQQPPVQPAKHPINHPVQHPIEPPVQQPPVQPVEHPIDNVDENMLDAPTPPRPKSPTHSSPRTSIPPVDAEEDAHLPPAPLKDADDDDDMGRTLVFRTPRQSRFMPAIVVTELPLHVTKSNASALEW